MILSPSCFHLSLTSLLHNWEFFCIFNWKGNPEKGVIEILKSIFSATCSSSRYVWYVMFDSVVHIWYAKWTYIRFFVLCFYFLLFFFITFCCLFGCDILWCCRAMPRVKVKILCAIILLLSTLVQDNLPYRSANPEVCIIYMALVILLHVKHLLKCFGEGSCVSDGWI